MSTALYSPVRTPNEESNLRALAGYQADPSIEVPPTFQLPGKYESNVTYPDTSEEEATGTMDKYVTPSLGQPEFDGTYTESTSFEGLTLLGRLGIRAGDPATLVSGATKAYERIFKFNPYGYDVDRITVQHFIEGLNWTDKGVSFKEWNISGDVDDNTGVWQMDGPLFLFGSHPTSGEYEGVMTAGTTTTMTDDKATWTVNEHAGKYVNLGVNNAAPLRLIESNTATTLTFSAPLTADQVPMANTAYRIEGKFTSGIARPKYAKIPTRGTKLFLDPITGTTGTTQVKHRFIKFNVTCAWNIDSKFFMDTPEGEIDRETPISREITFQIDLEMDRRDEFLQLQRSTMLRARIQQDGPEIEPGFKNLVQIDMENVSWKGIKKGTRKGNLTGTYEGRLYEAADNFALRTISALPRPA